MHHTYVIRRKFQRKYHGTFKFYYSCTFWFQAVKGICHERISGPYVNIQCRIAQQKLIGIIEPKNLYLIFQNLINYLTANNLLGDRYEAQTIYSQTQFLNNFFIFLLIFSTISFAWNGNIYHHLYITHFISNIHMKYILTFFPFLYLPHPTWSLHFGMWVFNLFSNFTKTKSVVTFVMLQKKG